MAKQLKDKFLDAIIEGGLGVLTKDGIIISSKEFTHYFITRGHKKEYLRCYLSSVVIEPGRHAMLHNKFLFRIKQGVFRLHPDAISRYLLNHNHKTHYAY